MDEINVDSGSLINASNTLGDLSNFVERLTDKTVNIINSQLNSLDDEFKKDIHVFLKQIKDFQIRLASLMNDTKSSLLVRNKIIVSYSMSNYLKRNIG